MSDDGKEGGLADDARVSGLFARGSTSGTVSEVFGRRRPPPRGSAGLSPFAAPGAECSHDVTCTTLAMLLFFIAQALGSAPAV